MAVSVQIAPSFEYQTVVNTFTFVSIVLLNVWSWVLQIRLNRAMDHIAELEKK